MTRKARIEGITAGSCRNRDPDSYMPVAGQRQVRPGQVLHGAYGLRKLLRRGGAAGRRQLKQVRDEHLRYLLSRGYATWESAPRPLQVLIEIAVELDLFRRALFAGFYRGQEVPKRYDGVTEMQRRVLIGLGVLGEPRVPDLEAILGTMTQEPPPPEKTPLPRSGEVEGAIG